MSQFYFDQFNVSNFLNPDIFFVGAHFDGKDSHMNEFINNSTWKMALDKDDDGKETQTSKWLSNVGKGDVLIAKRLNGKVAGTMTTLAIGIVIGLKAGGTLNVAWVLPEYFQTLPVNGCLGAISAPYKMRVLKQLGKDWEDLVDDVKKAQIKFLRLNLQIEKRIYL